MARLAEYYLFSPIIAAFVAFPVLLFCWVDPIVRRRGLRYPYLVALASAVLGGWAAILAYWAAADSTFRQHPIVDSSAALVGVLMPLVPASASYRFIRQARPAFRAAAATAIAVGLSPLSSLAWLFAACMNGSGCI